MFTNLMSVIFFFFDFPCLTNSPTASNMTLAHSSFGMPLLPEPMAGNAMEMYSCATFKLFKQARRRTYLLWDSPTSRKTGPTAWTTFLQGRYPEFVITASPSVSDPRARFAIILFDSTSITFPPLSSMALATPPSCRRQLLAAFTMTSTRSLVRSPL